MISSLDRLQLITFPCYPGEGLLTVLAGEDDGPDQPQPRDDGAVPQSVGRSGLRGASCRERGFLRDDKRGHHSQPDLGTVSGGP